MNPIASISIASNDAPLAHNARLLLSLLFAAALTACGGGGGGGGSDSSTDPIAGAPISSPPPPISGSSCDAAAGRVLEVGPGKAYTVPSAAANAAQSGDVIKIAAGDYRGDAATWSDSNLTICGVGGRARLFADGNNAQGKGIWVMSGSNITVDNIEFHNATVPDQNGAGIRAEPGASLVIRNSGFYDNQNGILASAGTSTISIDRSEFARNGVGDGQTHNIYVNQIDRLTVTSSYFHEAKIGHNLKSRARESIIQNSYFMDGPTGTSSYLNDFPNGGQVVLRGNVYHKGPNADNPNAISFGAEGLSNPTQSLEMVHNTVTITRSGGAFVSIASGTSSVRLIANLFAGTGNQTFITGGYASGNAAQSGNVTSLATNIAGATSIGSPNFWPNAALQALIALPGVLDPTYTADAPAPYTLRTISGARNAGAIQSAP